MTNEQMLEQTLSIFHSSNLNLQQQYQEKKFNKYYDLLVCILVAKKNDELLRKNHQNRSTKVSHSSKANAVNHNA